MNKITSTIVSLMLGLQFTSAQTQSCQQLDSNLSKLYAKIFPFYYGDNDSLVYYSNLFSSTLTDAVKNDSSTMSCPFTKLKSVCSIITSEDGLYRIYSWNTWQGGSAHMYSNLYQYKVGNKVMVDIPEYQEGNFGTDYLKVYTLKTNYKTYYLTINGGRFSSHDRYEGINVSWIDSNGLMRSAKLFKTPSGMENSIGFEYDFFSVVDRKESPFVLIKFDPLKKILYIPIVLEGGKVTDRYILYQFNGRYFEHILTQK